MTKFLKPSQDNPDYPQMAKTAVNRALADAGIDYKKIQAAVVGYVFGDSTCGQRYQIFYSQSCLLSRNEWSAYLQRQ